MAVLMTGSLAAGPAGCGTEKKMKNILCFGDSNTYGESPEGFGRYERHERWPGILQEKLGPEYYVIEEGLNGRTTVWDDPVEGDKNGLKHLPSCIASHTPLDLVIIMLGTNDFKSRFSVTSSEVAASAGQLVITARQVPNYKVDYPFKILLVSPPCLRDKTFLGEIMDHHYEDTKRLGALIAETARLHGTEFLDIAQVAEASELDGLHFDREAHKKVAAAMEQKIREILG